MKTYRVSFQRIETYLVDVEAETEEQAIELAQAADIEDLNAVEEAFDYYEVEIAL